jgi:hypothetical protein
MKSWLPQWKAMKMEDLVVEVKRPVGGKNNWTWVGWKKLE